MDGPAEDRSPLLIGKSPQQSSVLPVYVQHQPGFTLCFSFVDVGGLTTEGLTSLPASFGCFYALDATPALAAFRLDLAHFFFRMVRPTVITINGVSHDSFRFRQVVSQANFTVYPCLGTLPEIYRKAARQ
jgi:hypothetical protein